MRVSCFIAALVALTVVAGCGGSDDPAPRTTVSVTAPATTVSTTSTSTTPETTIPTEPDGGDGSTPDPGSGQGAPAPVLAAAAVLTTHATTEEACGSYVTEHFIETAYGGEQNCVAARKDQPLARRIAVDQSADNTESHLVVVPDGGPYDGAKVEVDIVEADGHYRVDALTAHVPTGP